MMSKVNRNIKENTIQHETMDDILARRTYLSTERHTKLYAGVLKDKFYIGPK